MTSKERIICMIEHRTTDRVPRGENTCDCDFYQQITGKKTLAYAGWDELETLWSGGRDEVVADYVDTLCTVAETLGWDYIRVPPAPKNIDYSGYKRIGDKKFQDGKGKIYLFNPDTGNIIHPEIWPEDLTVDDLEDPDSPFTVEDSEMDIARGVIEKMGKDHFVMGRLPYGGTFSYLQTVGMTEYMVRMITDPEFVHKVCKLYTNRAIKYCEAFLKLGCDGIMATEDYADSRSLIMGKARYEEFILPYLKRLTDAVHSMGGYMIKHSDGYMLDALDSFIEIGIDAWHGIQPNIGMDMKTIREKVSDRLCLFGGINIETYIIGTSEDIKREVRAAVKYGAAGGLVITGGNILEPGSKLENYQAVIEQLEEIGTFPIDYDSIVI